MSFDYIDAACTKIVNKHIELIAKYRAYAADKKNSYGTRLMFDKMAGWREECVINWANRIIKERENAV